MIQIFYSAPNDLDVSGTLADFIELRIAVLEMIGTAKVEVVVFPQIELDPKPYDRLLSKFIIRRGEGKVLAQIKDSDTLFVSGSCGSLESMLSYFDFEPHAKYPDHHHFEYYEDHQVIDANSVPICFTVRDNEDPAA